MAVSDVAKGAMTGAGLGAIGGPLGMALGGGLGAGLGFLGSLGSGPAGLSPEESEQARRAEAYYSDILSGKDEVGRAGMRYGMDQASQRGAGMLGSARVNPEVAMRMAAQQQLAGAAQAQAYYQANLERAQANAAQQLGQMGMGRERMQQEANIEQQRIAQTDAASSRQLKGSVIGGLSQAGIEYAPQIMKYAKESWSPYV